MAGASTSSQHAAHSSPLLARVTESLANSAAAQSLRGQVRIEVLFSVPRQARDLYPYAHIDARDVGRTAKATAVEAYVEHIFMTASHVPDDAECSSDASSSSQDPAGTHGRKQGALIYALECFLYTLPKHKSALLYVSKLDSSGWGPKVPEKHLLPYLRSRRSPVSTVIRLDGRTSPRKSQQLASAPSSSSQQPLEASTSLTRVITETFLLHFASLEHWRADSRLPAVRHLSMHILARAQGAYLFPSSNENPRKHILSDGALIKWWRAVVTSVVCRVRRIPARQREIEVQPYYLIPGYDRLESHELLPIPPPSSQLRVQDIRQNSALPTGNEALSEAGWTYGHPYSRAGASLADETALPPLPLQGPHYSDDEVLSKASGGDANVSLDPSAIATLLPHFPDDPKSRFISELARDAHESITGGPPLKRVLLENKAAAPPRPLKDEDTDVDSNATPPPGSGTTTPRRRGRRGRSAAPSGSPSPVKLTSTQRQFMKERGALDAVTADEFWARMAFRQECCSGNAVGVFVALFTQIAGDERGVNGDGNGNGTAYRQVDGLEEGEELNDEGAGRRIRSLPSQPLSLPHNILREIIFKRLMIDACDWSKHAASLELTRNYESAVGHAIQRKGGIKEHLGTERAASEFALDDAGRVGEGFIWKQIAMSGPSATELEAAERRWKADGAARAQQTLGASIVPGQASMPATATTAPPVNTLMVKRKKKV